MSYSFDLKNNILVLALAALIMIPVSRLDAHCQIPCGIFDDHLRVLAMMEDAVTVEKSAKLINELAGKTDAQSMQQMVRWVMNKEDHAQKIITTVSDYFLTQRVKPDMKDYTERLTRHHAVILAAMATKQKADTTTVETLKKAIDALLVYYPEHKH